MEQEFRETIDAVNEAFESRFFFEDIRFEAKRLILIKKWDALFFLLDYYQRKAKDDPDNISTHRQVLEDVAWLIFNNIDPAYGMEFKEKYGSFLTTYDDEDD